MTHNYLFKTLLLLLCSNWLMAQDLVHYWSFNQSESLNALLTPTQSMLSGASIEHIQGSSTSVVDFSSNTGQDFATLNARFGEEALTHLRFNNPVGGELIFSLPTTGYSNPVITYVTRRSTQSARSQVVSYTTDGVNYTFFEDLVITEVPTLITLDFSGIDAADNNANFKIKFEFVQVEGNGAGNNRFDNFAMDATSLSGDVNPPLAAFSPANNAMNLPVNGQFTITFNEDIRLAGGIEPTNDNLVQAFELKKGTTSAGLAESFTATIDGRVVTITPVADLQNGQDYYIGVKANAIEDLSGNVLSAESGITIRTIGLQTAFAPGDLVIVAYRMNNSDKSDEFAFLALKDILAGTLITFTDGKYTNDGTQCPGGLVWTAPQQGVKKGEVVTIVNDSPSSASVGTLSGSSFGLSSGGDQIMVYAGTVENPVYITALSANEWVADKPSCSGGSTSKLPSSLVDGTSAINLSTAVGSVNGLSVNAHYAGPQNADDENALRSLILNPANWIASGSGTPAQSWPAFKFLKSLPSVVKAQVLNAFSIRVIFDRDLDKTSASAPSNYSNVDGLVSVMVSENGSLADTVTLTYSSAFSSGINYSLLVQNIIDAEGNSMEVPYTFNFNYNNSSVAFEKEFYIVQENAGVLSVILTIENPVDASFDLVLKGQPWSTAGAADITFATQTIQLLASGSNTIQLDIPIVDDQENENDEYFVLSIENANGISVKGFPYATVHIRDNDRKAPVATEEFNLKLVTSFDPSTEGSTTESISYDPQTHRIYASSAIQNRFDIIDFSNPANPVTLKSVSMAAYGSGITGVAAKNGIVAVGAPATIDTDNGSVVFFTSDGDFVSSLTVGALPDMVAFTPDGTKVITTDEGQPNNSYTIDPEGSVSIIDVSQGLYSIDQSKVTTLYFTQFNADEATLIASGVRKTFAASTLSQDLEPEYITVTADSKKAWVSLQENNAMAEIDLDTKSITSIWALGTKDYSQFGNGADMSTSSGAILLANWPVKGFYMPDAIASYSVNGVNYIVTANEGDEKEYAGLNERVTVGANAVVLDPQIFPNAEVLKKNYNLGAFRLTNLNGDIDKDGDYDELYAVGSRSFSIFNSDTKELVFDSGDDFDYIVAQHPVFNVLYNSNHEINNFKGRSNTKGCEPEAVAIAEIEGNVYAFIGLERVGGVMVYNITNPTNPVFVDYQNNRSVSSYEGDHGPEYVVYVNPQDSPDGKHYILVSNEISGTITVFELANGIITNTDKTVVEENSLVVYPNPARETLNFNQQTSVVVESISGQEVLRANAVRSINIGNLNKGIYILKSAEGEIRKFIVE